MTLGEKLKEIRKKFGLSQEQLAEKLTVSNRSVSRWETGSTLPDISILIELSEFYDKPLTSDLLFEATKVLYCKMVKLRNKVNKIMEEKGVKRRNYSRAKLKRYEKIVKLKKCEYDKAKQFCKGCSQTEDVCQ